MDCVLPAKSNMLYNAALLVVKRKAFQRKQKDSACCEKQTYSIVDH